MNILCTVGTTDFAELTLKMITLFDFAGSNVVLQTAKTYQTNHIESFAYSENINSYIAKSEIVVTHAGAGSVYQLLELNKKIVVVPDVYRDDKHQVEIARFVEDNYLGIVCWNLDSLESSLEEVTSKQFNNYVKDSFFKYDEINSIIG
ncbi:PssE/Cps14G family polysaccharide biosynthesis glycosyltransferase [Cobetia marina]|uniref:PssE/Cps14G family polysaccharide biosynthesis glycosyltransferase n=1 Tax=Cobetia marina TaxID=28258 RepID=A0ABU9GBM8_COBMA